MNEATLTHDRANGVMCVGKRLSRWESVRLGRVEQGHAP